MTPTVALILINFNGIYEQVVISTPRLNKMAPVLPVHHVAFLVMIIKLELGSATKWGFAKERPEDFTEVSYRIYLGSKYVWS